MSETAVTARPAAPWYREITAKQWYALAAGQAGWALDAFDVMLYSFCLTTIMREWHSTPAAAGFMVTVTLFASSVGGIVFGAVADRIGRKKALMLTVLLFSLCSGLSGLTQNLTQLAIARTLLGLGMGGEWASGALLVSETWPPQHRGKAIGIMQSGWAIGYILAAVCGWLVLPALGWRAMFFVGVLPALFTLWIRTKLEEPEIWVKAAAANTAQAKSEFGFLQIFAPDLLRFTLLSTLTSALVMFAYWGLFTWMPGFLSQPLGRGGAGLGVRGALWIIPMMTGAFFGYISFGFIADRFGRRPTFAAYLLISAVLVWIFGTTRDAGRPALAGPLPRLLRLRLLLRLRRLHLGAVPHPGPRVGGGLLLQRRPDAQRVRPHRGRRPLGALRSGRGARLPRHRLRRRGGLDLPAARDARAGTDLSGRPSRPRAHLGGAVRAARGAGHRGEHGRAPRRVHRGGGAASSGRPAGHVHQEPLPARQEGRDVAGGVPRGPGRGPAGRSPSASARSTSPSGARSG